LAKESDAAILAKLRSVPLLSGLKDKDLKPLVRAGKQLSYPEGRIIVSEGDMGVAFYLILDGEVEVKRKGRAVAKLGAGSFFGEMSLLDSVPRNSDVVAVAPTTCLVLSSWQFQVQVKENSEVALKMLKTVTQRLRESNKALSD